MNYQIFIGDQPDERQHLASGRQANGDQAERSIRRSTEPG